MYIGSRGEKGGKGCLDRDNNSVTKSSMVRKYRTYSEEWWGSIWYFGNVDSGRLARDLKHASVNAYLCIYLPIYLFIFGQYFLKWDLQTYKIHVFSFRLFLQQQRIISHSHLYLHYGSAVALLHSRTEAIATASVWNIFLVGRAEEKKNMQSYAMSFKAFVQKWCISLAR